MKVARTVSTIDTVSIVSGLLCPQDVPHCHQQIDSRHPFHEHHSIHCDEWASKRYHARALYHTITTKLAQTTAIVKTSTTPTTRRCACEFLRDVCHGGRTTRSVFLREKSNSTLRNSFLRITFVALRLRLARIVDAK